jgi:putative nucleotidyltransferase-like protein
LSSGRRSGSFWPSGTQRALLEVGLGPEEQAAARWQALQPLDVTALETGSFGLLPPLYERLRGVAPDDSQLPRLFGTYRSVWFRNQLLLERLAVLLPLLRQRAGCRPLLVGGMSAVLRWYPRLGLRPVPQLELVVEREIAAEAVKVSTYAGWRSDAETRSASVLRDESRRVLVIHHGPPAAVLGPLGDEGLPAFRERAVELDGVDGEPLVLDPADEILFICAMGARTVPVQTCQWLVDVHCVLQSPDAPAPATLLERARRVHLVACVRATLDYLAEIIPGEAQSRYSAAFDAEPVQRRDRLAFGLAGVGRRRLAGAAQVLAAYVQATADDPPLRAAARLPRHLQTRWEAESLAGVPALALRKALRLAIPQARTSPDRNRSASS